MVQKRFSESNKEAVACRTDAAQGKGRAKVALAVGMARQPVYT